MWSLGWTSALAISQSTFAVAVVVALFGLFVLLLFGSLVRSRTATARLAAAGEAGAPGPGRPAVRTERAPRPKAVISRRDFFRGSLLASLGVFTAQFGGATVGFLWPNLKGGFGTTITLSDSPGSILQQVRSSQEPFYFGAGRFYLIDYQGEGDKPGGIYQGLTAEVPGGGRLMAIYQKCAHLGCRVPFCKQSQWFECPCHGSKYNLAGEYELGPAPTGLARFPVKIVGGQIQVNTGAPGPWPPRGTDTIHEAPQGPFCVA